MDYAEFRGIFLRLVYAFREELPATTVRVYWEHLDDLTKDVFDGAVSDCIVHLDGFPTIHQILQFAEARS
jgi:hypothetical protein